jgi:hypothetical protein
LLTYNQEISIATVFIVGGLFGSIVGGVNISQVGVGSGGSLSRELEIVLIV